LDKFDGHHLKSLTLGMCLWQRSSTLCENLSKNFNNYIKIVFRDARIFFQHQAELVLRHPMQVSIYFAKLFYSAVWDEEEIAEVGEYSCRKPTTTVGVGGLAHTKLLSRLPELSSKAWPEGSINIL
jgi:hypothetical protein